MPRLTNNSLASLPGTDFSFPSVTSDDLSPASSSLSTTSVGPSGADLVLYDVIYPPKFKFLFDIPVFVFYIMVKIFIFDI